MTAWIVVAVWWGADVPSEYRKAALQSVVALLPDEHRQALHCLLLFLNRLADYAAENQVQYPLSSLCNPHSLHILCRQYITHNTLSVIQ